MKGDVCTNLKFRFNALISDCGLHVLITDCGLHVLINGRGLDALITAGCWCCLAGTKEHTQHLGQEARIGSIFATDGHQK